MARSRSEGWGCLGETRRSSLATRGGHGVTPMHHPPSRIPLKGDAPTGCWLPTARKNAIRHRMLSFELLPLLPARFLVRAQARQLHTLHWRQDVVDLRTRRGASQHARGCRRLPLAPDCWPQSRAACASSTGAPWRGKPTTRTKAAVMRRWRIGTICNAGRASTPRCSRMAANCSRYVCRRRCATCCRAGSPAGVTCCARLAEGHGLGLTLVQRVVKAHGGEVRAENAQGGGLRVSLRLPLAREQTG